MGTYAITFIDGGGRQHRVLVDPARTAFTGHGRPGSLLAIALAHGIEIEHACGGFCACATCHVIVREGLDACNRPTEEEEDQLDVACGVTAQSRLACQCVPTGARDLLVIVPNWNRNLAGERHR